MYLISDDFGEQKWLLNFKELKEMLVDEIKRDTLENFKEFEIVESNINQLAKLLEKEFIEDYEIIKQLESYGYSCIYLSSLIADLKTIQQYFCNDEDIKEEIQKTINIVGDMK